MFLDHTPANTRFGRVGGERLHHGIPEPTSRWYACDAGKVSWRAPALCAEASPVGTDRAPGPDRGRD